MDIENLYNEFIDNTESDNLHNNSIDSKHKKILKESSEQIKKLSYKNFRNWDSQNDMGLKYSMTFFSKIFLGINSLIFLTQFFDILKKRINHFFEYSSMLDDIQVIKKIDHENILQDNPQNKTPGAINFPLVDNYSVTKRWLRYLYLFIQLKQNKILSNNLIWVDIGSYYGGLQGIVKKYFPNSIIFMVDFTHQLSRSYIYLKNLYPDSNHIFPKGTKGTDIDYLARESLNEVGCDYDHGTGHGIGSFLSVHEAPQRISKKNMYPSVDLLSGMILSNEPGFYKEGEYGIRIENILIVTEENENLFNFENISWAPIDKDLIEPSLLNSNDLKWLNNYHQTVFDKLSTFLTAEEKLWLQKVTLPL